MTNDTEDRAPEPEEPAVSGDVERLKEELERERNQATDYMKRWQYAQAEIANVRRRGQQEREELTKYGAAPLVAGIVEVLDNFERAEQTIPSGLRSFTWINGVLLIHRQLAYLLEQYGLEPIAAEGQPYDAQWHEAVAEEPHERIAAGHVIAELQRGYRLHGRLLRPSLVRVSKGPPASAETGTVAEEAPPPGAATDAAEDGRTEAGADDHVAEHEPPAGEAAHG